MPRISIKILFQLSLFFLFHQRTLQSDAEPEDTPIDDSPIPDPSDHIEEYTVVFLVEYVSEGAKVPLNPFFHLEHSDIYGVNQLTPDGEKQVYNLGSAIQAKYPKLFKPISDQGVYPTRLYTAYSARTPVSQSTAISHLLGIYSPSKEFSPLITSMTFSETKKPPYRTKG